MAYITGMAAPGSAADSSRAFILVRILGNDVCNFVSFVLVAHFFSIISIPREALVQDCATVLVWPGPLIFSIDQDLVGGDISIQMATGIIQRVTGLPGKAGLPVNGEVSLMFACVR